MENFIQKIITGHLECITFIGGGIHHIYKESDEGIERTCGPENMALARIFYGNCEKMLRSLGENREAGEKKYGRILRERYQEFPEISSPVSCIGHRDFAYH